MNKKTDRLAKIKLNKSVLSYIMCQNPLFVCSFLSSQHKRSSWKETQNFVKTILPSEKSKYNVELVAVISVYALAFLMFIAGVLYQRIRRRNATNNGKIET